MFTPLRDDQDVLADQVAVAKSRQGFTQATERKVRTGFTAIEEMPPSVVESVKETVAPALKTVRAMIDPIAVAETGANLLTGAAAMPVAGIAGLGAMAAKALGADVDPAEVVHKTGDALTYKPKTERGEHLARATLYPLEKLSEAGRYAGEATQDATGSPAAATAVETAINVAPFVPGFVKALRRPTTTAPQGERQSGEPAPQDVRPDVAEANRSPSSNSPQTIVEKSAQPDSESRAIVSDKPMPVADHGIGRQTDPAADALAQIERQDVLDAVTEVERQRAAADQRRAVAEQQAAAKAQAEATTEPPAARAGIAEPQSPIEPERVAPVPPTQAREARPAVVEPPKAPALSPRHAAIDAMLREGERARDLEADRLMAEARQLQTAPRGIPADRGGAELPVDRAAMQTRLGDPPARPAPEVVAQGFTALSAIERPAVRPEAPAIPLDGGARILGGDTRTMNDGLLKLVAEKGRGPVVDVARAELDRRAQERPADRATESPDALAAQRIESQPGSQHVGMIGDVASANTTPRRAEPIRREEILAPLLKALGVSVYEGRVKGGKTLGWYLPKREAVRIKHKSDMETVAHEIAHMIDDRIFNGFGREKGQPNTRPWTAGPDAATFGDELRSVSYDQRKVYEGFAEFVRLYMTQPEIARAKVPKFSAWFDKFIEQHKYGSALAEAKKGMVDWFRQDAIDRARSKIGAQADINESLNGFWDRFRQATVDDLHGVYRMERKLWGGIAPMGAYETARLTRASGSITDGALRYGVPVIEHDGSFSFKGKGLEQILDPVSKTPAQLNDFLLYAVGRSAKELKGQGRERLFTNAEINAMVALETPEFKKAFIEYQFWNMGILDFAEHLGLINPSARAAWQRTNYLPFHRVGTTTERARGGVSGNWHGIKTLTGGTENIRDVLGNVIGNAHMLIDAALKNEARAMIVAVAEDTRGGGRFIMAIPPESKPVKIDKPQIREKLIEVAGGNPHNPPPQLAAIIDSLLANAPYLMDFLVKGQAPSGGNVIAVLKSGKPNYYEVADPILYRAVQALNRPAQSALIKWLAIPKRIGQASITLTPDFAFANIARDTLMGAITSRAGFLPAIDSIRGMNARITNDPMYREYLANGGGFASYLVDENAFRAHLDRFYSEKGFNAKTMLDAPDKFLYFAETLFDSFEVSTRMGEYMRLREKGTEPRHAAYLSREVSTDFAMKGDNPTLNALYDIVMFLRPAVVSMDRLYRGLAHDPNNGAIAAKSGAVAFASAALYLINRENPKYQDLPDWERDAYWSFFVPTPDGDELHFRYPKIWEIGALGTLAERSVERIMENEPKELAKDFGRVLKQQFMLNVVPQAVAPIYELARNKSTFTGKPIESQVLQNLQPFMRANPGTSETMRSLGMASRSLPESLQVNPVAAEHLLRGYLNTWATYGLMLSDAALFSDKVPERRLDQYPVIKRFYREEPPLTTRHEEKFHELFDEARRLRSTMRELDREGRRGIADELERDPLATRAAQLDRVEKRLTAIRHEAIAVRLSNLSPAEKRAKFNELTVERNALLKATVRDVKASTTSAP